MRNLIFVILSIFLLTSSLFSQMSDQQRADSVFNSMDYTSSNVRDLAVRLARKAGGTYNIKQICYIWDYVKKHWSYVNDPSGSEYFAKASESASLLAGDCDDFAILLAALLKSIGGTPRVILAFSNTSGHAYTEIYATNNYQDLLKLFESIQDHYFWSNLFSGKKLTLYYEKDGNGSYWINLDWNSRYVGDSPFFDFTQRIIIFDDGTFTTEYK